MRVLGLDPSLTNYGWAVHDTSGGSLSGDPPRCVARGRFQTGSKELFVARYMQLRERLADLIRDQRPDRVGIEFPVFDNLFSEGMYGLFLFSCEALLTANVNVVFWSPLQVKAHARESLGRPKGWVMMKPDMVEAAKADTGTKGVWNHNEADAYLVGRLSGRFWNYYEGGIPETELTPTERKYFTEVKTYTRGKRAGETVRRGVVYREDERFFNWAEVLDGESTTGGEEREVGVGEGGDHEDPQDGIVARHP